MEDNNLILFCKIAYYVTTFVYIYIPSHVYLQILVSGFVSESIPLNIMN